MEASDIQRIRTKINEMGRVYSPGNASKPGHLYSPLPFDEFKDVPVQRNACKERFNLMLPHARGKDLLDLGCHTGYNCFMFERHGFECVGLEVHPLTVEIAKDVAETTGSTSRFVCTKVTPSALDVLLENRNFKRFDVCLFLSLFQWLAAYDTFWGATRVLEKALWGSDQLFFETSMGVEGKAKLPMLPDTEAVKEFLEALGAKVTILGELEAPGGKEHPKRTLFLCER